MKTIKFSKTIISLSTLIFMGYTLLISPNTALAVVSQPVSAPVSIPVSIPISIPVPIPVIMPGAPEMVYPGNGQTLVLEDGYMFKVKPVDGASGYLIGLFQDNNIIFDNYRDTKTLSTNGEFTLWQDNPFHNKFHAGQVKVIIRAYVNNKWTDAREITITLKSRFPAPTPIPTSIPMPGAPEMVYPGNGQTLVLEDAYMFKVKPINGASKYSFGLSQNGAEITNALSSNVEFAIWQNNPAHAMFKEGNVTVSIKALVNGNWTDARETTITLKSRFPAPTATPTPIATASARLVSIQTIAEPILGTNPKPILNPILNPIYQVTVKSAISTPSATLTPVAPTVINTYKPTILEILLAFLRRLWFS